MDPLLIDGIAAFVVFALMAGQFIGTRHLLPGQHPTTVLTWLLAVLIVAPILTHRRFPRASVAVCLAALRSTPPGATTPTRGLACSWSLRHHAARHEAAGRRDLVSCAAAMAVAVGLQPGVAAPTSPGWRANSASRWPG